MNINNWIQSKIVPVTAYLYVTYRCNSRCRFCRIWQEQDKALPDILPEMGIKLLDDLRKIGVRHVDITGGEPLLYKPLPELLRYARSIGLFTSVTTNGLLYQKRASELIGLPESLGFSLNGPNAKTHDSVQGVKSFDKVIESIKLALNKGEAVHAHFTATNESITYMDDMIALARKLGAALVIFPEFSYFGNSSISKDCLEKVLAAARKPGVCVNTASVRFQLQGGNDINNPTCTAGRSSLAIAPDGSIILPCYHNAVHNIPTSGKLYDTYTSPQTQDIISRSGKYSFCKDCTNWCYINPSFAYHFDKYGLQYYASTFKRTHAVLGRGWLLRMPGVFAKGLLRPVKK